MDLVSPSGAPTPSAVSLTAILPSPNAAAAATPKAAAPTAAAAATAQPAAPVSTASLRGDEDLLSHFGLSRAFAKYAAKASLPPSFAHYVRELPGSIVYGHSLHPPTTAAGAANAAAEHKQKADAAAAQAAALQAAAAGGMSAAAAASAAASGGDLRAEGWDVDAMKLAPLLYALVPLTPPRPKHVPPQPLRPPATAVAGDAANGRGDAGAFSLAPGLLSRALRFSAASTGSAPAPLNLLHKEANLPDAEKRKRAKKLAKQQAAAAAASGAASSSAAAAVAAAAGGALAGGSKRNADAANAVAPGTAALPSSEPAAKRARVTMAPPAAVAR